MLFLVQSGMAALAVAMVASGGEQPAKNPLAAESAVDDPVAGTFKGEKFTITLKRVEAGKYAGMIRMGDQEFPATAGGDARRLQGKFTSEGSAFEFSAAIDGDTLTLSTEGTAYALQREAPPRPKNPLAGGPPPGKAAASQPEGMPGKLEVIRETPTGKALFESRPGVRSAKDLLAGVTKELFAYFGERPAVTGAFSDAKDLRGGASFTAHVKDRPIKGMILVGIGEKGGAVTVVFDSADAPARNLSALAAALPTETRWEDVRFPDGSGSMKLPAGWRVTGAANGAVDVLGPEGQNVELGLAYPVNTPEAEAQFREQQAAVGIRPQPSRMMVAPFPPNPARAVEMMVPVFSKMFEANGAAPITLEKIVESTPIPCQLPGGNAGFVHSIAHVGQGDAAMRFHSLGVVMSAPTGNGVWMYYTSYVAAREDLFARDLPTMMQIWSSWKVSDQVLQARLKKATEDLKSAGEMMRQSNEYAARVRSRSNADFDEVIRGYRTVEDTQFGTRSEVDLGNVDKIVEKLNEGEGYDRYKQIPLRDQ